MSYYGGRIYLNLKESSMMIDRALGVYEYWKTCLFMRLIESDMIVADIGTNKGYFSFLFAKLMNDKGKVLSFEPHPGNCFWVRKSISANKYTSIKLFNCALSDREGKAVFYPGKKSGWGSLFFSPSATLSKEASFRVKTYRLDKILEEENIDNIDVIKMDVEGADLLVLRGGREYT